MNDSFRGRPVVTASRMIAYATRQAHADVRQRVCLTGAEFEKQLTDWVIDRAIAERISTHIYPSALNLAVALYRRRFIQLLRSPQPRLFPIEHVA